MTELTAVRVAAFNNLKEAGKSTSDAIYQIVVESSMPLTVNEITALFTDKTERSISREYTRARLEQLEAVDKVGSRPETPSEMKLRGDARGGAHRVFYTETTPQLTRAQLPDVPSAALRLVRRQNRLHNRKATRRRGAKTTSSTTTDSLAKVLDALYADRTVELRARIKVLEARLAQIAKLAK